MHQMSATQNAEDAAASAVEGAEYPDLDIQQVMEVLPHRYPMLLIDKIIEVKPGVSAVGIKNVTINEPFFPGHFPEKPVMPGVLLIEAMAQTAAAFVSKTENLPRDGHIVLFMSIDKARFRRPVIPGDCMRVEVSIAQARPPVWKFQGKCVVDGAVAADANYSAMLINADQA